MNVGRCKGHCVLRDVSENVGEATLLWSPGLSSMRVDLREPCLKAEERTRFFSAPRIFCEFPFRARPGIDGLSVQGEHTVVLRSRSSEGTCPGEPCSRGRQHDHAGWMDGVSRWNTSLP